MISKRNIIKYKDTAADMMFTVIGISSHENDFRLSWSINEELGLSFARNDENLETGDGQEFTYFVHQDEDKCLALISNRCENGFLIEKHKNLDFLLKFNTELNEEETAEWIKKLRNVTLISASFKIQADKKIMQMIEMCSDVCSSSF